MASKLDMTLHLLNYAYQIMKGHFQHITLNEAFLSLPGDTDPCLGL